MRSVRTMTLAIFIAASSLLTMGAAQPKVAMHQVMIEPGDNGVTYAIEQWTFNINQNVVGITGAKGMAKPGSSPFDRWQDGSYLVDYSAMNYALQSYLGIKSSIQGNNIYLSVPDGLRWTPMSSVQPQSGPNYVNIYVNGQCVLSPKKFVIKVYPPSMSAAHQTLHVGSSKPLHVISLGAYEILFAHMQQLHVLNFIDGGDGSDIHQLEIYSSQPFAVNGQMYYSDTKGVNIQYLNGRYVFRVSRSAIESILPTFQTTYAETRELAIGNHVGSAFPEWTQKIANECVSEATSWINSVSFWFRDGDVYIQAPNFYTQQPWNAEIASDYWVGNEPPPIQFSYDRGVTWHKGLWMYESFSFYIAPPSISGVQPNKAPIITVRFPNPSPWHVEMDAYGEGFCGVQFCNVNGIWYLVFT